MLVAAAAEHKAKLSGEFCGNYVVDQVMEWNSPLSFPPSPRIDISREGRAGGEVCLHHLYIFSAHAKLGKGEADEFIKVSDGEVAKRGCVFWPTPLAEMTRFQGCHQSLYPTVSL